MLLTNYGPKDAANAMIIKAVKDQNYLYSWMKRMKRRIRSWQPKHWFDGFMDDIIIDLNDVK